VTGVVLGAGIVVERTRLAGIDESLFLALNGLGHGPDLLDDVIVGPDFRNYALLAVATTAAAIRWRRAKVLRSLGLVALAGLLAFAMVRCIWALWDRARPQEVLDDAAVGAHDWAPYPSFPSGHVAVWLAMALVIGVLFPRSRLPLLALVATVALTRIVFGAHFPSDVLAAVVIGWAAARAAVRIVPARDAPGSAGAQLSDAATMRAESRSRRNELTSPP
jgi:membrane-associated phospholipid phosphatase